jgi:hypothetical protein
MKLAGVAVEQQAEEQRPSVWETGIERGRHSRTPELGINDVLGVDETGLLINLDVLL